MTRVQPAESLTLASIPGRGLGIRVAWAFLAITTIGDALAAGQPFAFLRKSDLYSFKQIRQAVGTEQSEQPDNPESVGVSFALGLAYEKDAGDGRTRAIPFNFNYTQKAWYFEVSGDGPTESDLAGARRHGSADVSLVVHRTSTWSGEKYSLAPEYELVVPSHGQVGSTGFAQIGRISFVYAPMPTLGIKLGAAVARDSDVTAGVSRYSRAVTTKLLLTDAGNPDNALTLGLKQTFSRGGQAGGTDLLAEGDIRLDPQRDAKTSAAKWIGSVVVRRALYAPAVTRLDVAVAYSF